MRAKVVLLARIRDDAGKYPFLPVKFVRGRPAPADAAVVGYYLRYSQNGQRKVRPVGKNLDEAFVAYQNEELNQTRSRMGLSTVTTDRVRLQDAVTRYLEELSFDVRMGKKSRRTMESYRLAIEDFQKNCGVEYLDEITGPVLQKYERFLFDNLKKRIRGKKANTISNRFRFISVFLSRQGTRMIRRANSGPDDKGLLSPSDAPREERKQNIDKYSEDEIKAMLSVADVDETDLIQTFLRTGCRDEEIAYLKWTDLDWKRQQVVISEKPEFNWRPKDREARTIPLEDGVLLKRLEARRQRQSPKTDLVFPNTIGKPDMHLIQHLHRVVKKARSKGSDFEGEITLHKFRRTFASMMIRHSDLQTVSRLLGHSDIQTTARYLAPDQSKARMGSRTAFKGLGD